ncbi:hypothetical protein K435DRAFT_780752 [Dendrothele bispora CBS 962.96]|uniref:Tyrosinase copper-binding domain-containing protein n=1 Tax=Dendrothele bispora (strain CBS 962.96) TaxID=1314807 RepID=A0A4S8LPW4_DENBC|nr:hypothetical protein K435DRAFT_780752 [Dendrothele bispora CBS 962.96]
MCRRLDHSVTYTTTPFFFLVGLASFLPTDPIFLINHGRLDPHSKPRPGAKKYAERN